MADLNDGYGAVTVTTTATRIVDGTSQRNGLVIVNNGAAALYVGLDSSVTTSNGLPVAAAANINFGAEHSGEVYGICASGTLDVRYLEVS